ncbi:MULTISPECIES: ABC transporter permease [Streptomyces]|uniref:ABC transporter permease n=1 Tax=Streptomyces sudanensis TaxID=436397 RepID=A0ABY4T8L4_9ACTN|nr:MULTISPECIES: ABC transporter permease [Streptomyces]MCP9957600.1 ABC transporter permease [Streptomyces sudanensis]MCP9986725.1 ABC transporter permease [Streptomyces sudanensis]MCQ0001857.1 ABC transporter permease [Streptomyces sudanensis]URN15294.1 ABC transporter permease [Streptomyces sudanensis]
MSESTSTVTPAATAPRKGGGRRRPSLPVVLLIVAAGLALFSLVRVVSGADDLTSVGQVSGALQLAVPIGLAGLGGLWAERAGVVNIGLEGMMVLGTWFGAWAGYQWGPWSGVLLGLVGGALGGLLHAVMTVTFNVNHIVSGVAINILALGATQYLSNFTFAEAAGGSSKQSPPIEAIDRITVPGLSEWLGDLQAEHWFLVSDLAGLLGGLVTNLSLLTVVALLLVPATWWILWRTAFGLRLRSCGENPVAAESLGVDVYAYKYVAVLVSGALAGLGGAFLAIVSTGIYQEGQTGGRGFIGLAAMIFGNWMPGGLALGAGLFGFTDSLKLRGGAENVHAMLLLLAILLLVAVAWTLYRRKYAAAAVSAVASAGLFVWYALTDKLPSQFVDAAPYVTTLLVLALSAQRLRMPKADGLPYRKGQGK